MADQDGIGQSRGAAAPLVGLHPEPAAREATGVAGDGGVARDQIGALDVQPAPAVARLVAGHHGVDQVRDAALICATHVQAAPIPGRGIGQDGRAADGHLAFPQKDAAAPLAAFCVDGDIGTDQVAAQLSRGGIQVHAAPAGVGDVVAHAVANHQNAGTARRNNPGAIIGGGVGYDGVGNECGRAAGQTNAAAIIARSVGEDGVADERGRTVSQSDSPGDIGRVAVHPAVADGGGGGDNAHPTRSIDRRQRRLRRQATTQARCIAAGDAKTRYRRRDHLCGISGRVAQDGHTPALPAGIQRRRVVGGIGGTGKGIGRAIAALQGQRLADINHLGHVGRARIAGEGFAGMDIIVGARRDADLVARLGTIDRVLDGAAGTGRAATAGGVRATGCHADDARTGLGPGRVGCSAAQRPDQCQGQSQAQGKRDQQVLGVAVHFSSSCKVSYGSGGCPSGSCVAR